MANPHVLIVATVTAFVGGVVFVVLWTALQAALDLFLSGVVRATQWLKGGSSQPFPHSLQRSKGDLLNPRTPPRPKLATSSAKSAAARQGSGFAVLMPRD